MSGSNFPVYYIRDPLKFPDLIHTHKRHPQTNIPCADAYWDFLSCSPETLHQVLLLYSDRGIPEGHAHMNGYSGHAFKFIDSKDEERFVKFHFKTNQKIRNLDDAQAREIAGQNPDYSGQDLFDRIKSGNFPSWTVYVQIMNPEQASTYRWNVCDVTKVWPHAEFPLIKIGTLVLNRNPDNHFAEVEQVAFSPANLVPGISVSNDKLLNGRLFSCSDAARYRLGTNFMQIPINQPYTTRVYNHYRDGSMCVDGNGGSSANYSVSSLVKESESDPEDTNAGLYSQNKQSLSIGY